MISAKRLLQVAASVACLTGMAGTAYAVTSADVSKGETASVMTLPLPPVPATSLVSKLSTPSTLTTDAPFPTTTAPTITTPAPVPAPAPAPPVPETTVPAPADAPAAQTPAAEAPAEAPAQAAAPVAETAPPAPPPAPMPARPVAKVQAAAAPASPPADPASLGVAGDSADEMSFFDLTNATRASIGVPPLRFDGNLQAYARKQAQAMANAGSLFHSNISSLLGTYSTAGENVGVGPAVASINGALIASPGHYRNISDPSFTHMGVGVVVDGAGRIWTAHVFAA